MGNSIKLDGADKGPDEKSTWVSLLGINLWPWVATDVHIGHSHYLQENATVNTEHMWYIINQEADISLWEHNNYADKDEIPSGRGIKKKNKKKIPVQPCVASVISLKSKVKNWLNKETSWSEQSVIKLP